MDLEKNKQRLEILAAEVEELKRNGGGGGTTDSYTKAEADNKFAEKTNVYTKTEADTAFVKVADETLIINGDNVKTSNATIEENGKGIAFGNGCLIPTPSSNSFSIAIGKGAKASNGSISIGEGQAIHPNSILIGGQGTPKESVLIGKSITLSYDSVMSGLIAIGYNAQPRYTGSICIGKDAVSTERAVVIGESAATNGARTVAIGFQTGLNAQSSVFIGTGLKGSTTGMFHVGIGTEATTAGNNSIAIGTGTLSNQNSVALGHFNKTIPNENTFVVGNGTGSNNRSNLFSYANGLFYRGNDTVGYDLCYFAPADETLTDGGTISATALANALKHVPLSFNAHLCYYSYEDTNNVYYTSTRLNGASLHTNVVAINKTTGVATFNEFDQS